MVTAIGRMLAVGVFMRRTGTEVDGVAVGLTAAVGGTLDDWLVIISLLKFSVPAPPLVLAPELTF